MIDFNEIHVLLTAYRRDLLDRNYIGRSSNLTEDLQTASHLARVSRILDEIRESSNRTVDIDLELEVRNLREAAKHFESARTYAYEKGKLDGAANERERIQRDGQRDVEKRVEVLEAAVADLKKAAYDNTEDSVSEPGLETEEWVNTAITLRKRLDEAWTALLACVDAWDSDEGMTEACEVARKMVRPEAACTHHTDPKKQACCGCWDWPEAKR